MTKPKGTSELKTRTKVLDTKSGEGRSKTPEQKDAGAGLDVCSTARPGSNPVGGRGQERRTKKERWKF